MRWYGELGKGDECGREHVEGGSTKKGRQKRRMWRGLKKYGCVRGYGRLARGEEFDL